MSIVFRVIGISKDRRTPELKQRYAAAVAQAAQEKADTALEERWRAAAQAKQERLFFERVRQAQLLALPSMLRRQAD
ncbi:MAG: hypothetical protein ACRDRL_27135 [Sciscionella sp.]